MKQKLSLHNRFDFEVYDTVTKETEKFKAENIVLNGIYNALTSYWMYYMGVGTGTGVLDPTRTKLFSYLLAKSADTVEEIYDTNNTAHITGKCVFNENEAIGLWTEVGICNGASSSANFYTHALITDSDGNQITINKTATKIVTVYITVYGTITASDGSSVMGNPSENMLLRMFTTNYGGANNVRPAFAYSGLITKDKKPARMGTYPTVVNTTLTYDSTNRRYYTTLTRLGAAVNNYPIRGIYLHDGDDYNLGSMYGGMALPSPIFQSQEYTNVPMGVGDGVTSEFDLPLPFVLPDSEKIYVNGVQKTRGEDYSIRYGLRSTDNYVFKREGDRLFGPTTFEEIIEIPQSPSQDIIITSIDLTNGSDDNCAGYSLSVSKDGDNWTLVASSSSWGAKNKIPMTNFIPDTYKYIKLKVINSTSFYGYYMTLGTFQISVQPPATKNIIFNTPPALSDVITCDFSIDYINKTENFVVDTQFEILMGVD